MAVGMAPGLKGQIPALAYVASILDSEKATLNGSSINARKLCLVILWPRSEASN
jgi:hypothetical protein